MKPTNDINYKKRFDGTPSKRKFLGFNFYIQCNEKLSKHNRSILLSKSKDCLGFIYQLSTLSTEEKQRRGLVNELDSSLSDLELMEIWNPIYEEFGYMIPEFKEKWESKQISKGKFETNLLKIEKSQSEIEELRFRIFQLEFLIKKSKYVEGMG